MITPMLNMVDNVGNLAFPECRKAGAKYLPLLGNFLCKETAQKYPPAYEIFLHSTLIEASLCKTLHF